MDQQLARELIEREKDILTPAIEAEKTLYQNTTCPMCGTTGCEKQIPKPKVIETSQGPVVSDNVFGDLLVRGYAHCIHCNTSFNPHTGVIIKTDMSIIHAPPEVTLPE